jgi:hypothetical protein
MPWDIQKNNYPSNCNRSHLIYFFQCDLGCTSYLLLGNLLFVGVPGVAFIPAVAGVSAVAVVPAVDGVFAVATFPAYPGAMLL